ncbi:MAG TPA: hypothetical protein VLT82_22605 [Myxococcaceae bacterium]|nr:hypothetical protein [Myxococcaceae bacterium]
MTRHIAAGLLLLAGAGCTSLTSAADCSSSACPEGQTCDSQTQLCVLDLSPQITVLSPKADAAVKELALEVRGTVATWSDATLVGMSYQLVDAGTAGGVPVDGGLFSLTVPLPPLDGEDVQLVLLARDSQARERRLAVPFRVDDVPPHPRFSPADGERGADVQLTVDFGEAVTGAGVPAVLVPGGPTGVYDSVHQRYVFGGLDHDTGYRVDVDAGVVLDALGNPNQAATARFWTAAHPAQTGAIGGLDSVISFDAASDEDGVVTLAIETATKVIWGWFNPADGQFAQLTLLDVAAPPLAALRTSTAFQADGGDPLRVTSILQRDVTDRVDLRTGPVFSTPSAAYAIPTGPSCAEPAAALGTVGLVSATGTYSRGPYSLAIGFVPDRLAIRSDQFWEVVATDAQHRLLRAWFRASCGVAPVEEIRVDPPVRTDLADDPRFSLALPRADRSLLAFDTRTGTRVESCRSCESIADAGVCPATVERAATGGLTVASRHDGARVLGARRNASNLVELLERDLSTACDSPWTVLATAPDSASALAWQPAMFGRKPGLVYSTATDVRVYVP